MRKFGGLKTLDAILALCQRDGVTVDMGRYAEGMDTVKLEGGGAHVFLNTFNGKFWGVTPWGAEFDSQLTTHESEAWFQSLLMFFYEPLPDVAVSPFTTVPVTDGVGGPIIGSAVLHEDGTGTVMLMDKPQGTVHIAQADVYAEVAQQLFQDPATTEVVRGIAAAVTAPQGPEVVKPVEPQVIEAPGSYPNPFDQQ